MRSLILTFLLPLGLVAQNFEPDNVAPRELTFDQDSLHFYLEFDPEEGVARGAVQIFCHALEGSDSLFLDAQKRITIHEQVMFNGEAVEFDRTEDGIVIYPEGDWEEASIFIEFTSRPFKGIYFNGWNDPTGQARKQIFTQGQGIDHRHWLPHQDAQNDKLKTSMTIRFDKDFTVLGNGRLVRKREVEDDIEWTYAMDHPHSSYLIAFVIGQYREEIIGQEPIRANYMYLDHVNDTDLTYYANEQIWNYLNERIDHPYVWSSYRQVPVANFPHGAMENTTLTIFSENFISTPADFHDLNYVYVNAHELAHHWFGDLVTVPSSHDFWLHEGFATYYQMETEREVFGHEYYTYTWMEAFELTREANSRDQYPLQHSKAGSSRFYQLGALTLRALEREVGTAVFDSAVSIYLDRFAFKLVTTDDLQNVFEETCECDLDPFFEGFVRSPHSSTGMVEIEMDSTGEYVVRGKQVNKYGDPLPITNMLVRIWESEFDYTDEYVDFSNSQWKEFVRFETNWEATRTIEFDPYHDYPISWDFEMPDSLRFIHLMQSSPYTQARVISKFNFENELFQENGGLMIDIGPQCTRDSILAIAGRQQFKDYRSIMLFCLRRSDPEHAEQFFNNFPPTEIDEDLFEAFLEFIPMDTIITDNTAKSIAFALISADNGRIVEVFEQLDKRSGGIDRDIDLLVGNYIPLVKGASAPDGIPRLMDFAGPSYANDIRITAWAMLGQLKYAEKPLRDLQYAELTSRHRHLRNAAVRAVRGYLQNMDKERVIAEITFVLRDAHPNDIALVERILDIELDIE